MIADLRKIGLDRHAEPLAPKLAGHMNCDIPAASEAIVIRAKVLLSSDGDIAPEDACKQACESLSREFIGFKPDGTYDSSLELQEGASIVMEKRSQH